MKDFYKITFKIVHYDQYDSFIVAANTPEEAIGFLEKQHPPKRYREVDWEGGYTIKKIEPSDYKEASEVLGSFNAG